MIVTMGRRATTLLLATILALGMFLGGATARDASANAMSRDISGCSWASNYCRVEFTVSGCTQITATWYTNRGGINGYWSDTRTGCASGLASFYIHWDTRADILVLTTNGAGYLTWMGQPTVGW